MFEKIKTIFKKDKRTDLEKEIEGLLSKMKETDKTSDEYEILSRNLERLIRMNSRKEKFRISPDVIAMGVFGIIQLIIVLKHEETEVITSKAFNWIKRL